MAIRTAEPAQVLETSRVVRSVSEKSGESVPLDRCVHWACPRDLAPTHTWVRTSHRTSAPWTPPRSPGARDT
jgi:hypothetical protein